MSRIFQLLEPHLGRDAAGIVLTYLRLPLPYLSELLRGHRALRAIPHKVNAAYETVFTRGLLTEVVLFGKWLNVTEDGIRGRIGGALLWLHWRTVDLRLSRTSWGSVTMLTLNENDLDWVLVGRREKSSIPLGRVVAHDFRRQTGNHS